MSTPQSPVPAVGSEAPDFTLDGTEGVPVTLSAFRGRSNVLLAFFPLAFTSVCTTEVCDFTEHYDAYAATGTTVLPISVDSVPTLKEFKAKHGLGVTLLSDFFRTVSRAYGVLLEERFLSKRAYVLVDRDGIVRWTHVESELRHSRTTEELLAAIGALG